MCGFDYYDFEYFISKEDKGDIKTLYARRESSKKAGTPMSDKEFAMAVANIYKNSASKLPLFESFLGNSRELLNRCIIFVGSKSYGSNVINIISKYRHDYHTYFDDDRKNELEKFAKSGTNMLITCHRISQGIDIQSVDSIVLFASDRSKLETIQRLGRCLRVDPNNPNKRAVVVDFIRVKEGDNGSVETTSDESRRIWMQQLSKL